MANNYRTAAFADLVREKNPKPVEEFDYISSDGTKLKTDRTLLAEALAGQGDD